MTGDEFCALADRTGLSDARLGYALGSRGSRPNVAAKVRKWRNGSRPVTEEAASRLRALVAALDGRALPDTDAAIAAALEERLPPEWLIATEAPGTDDEAPEYLVHTRRPRFCCRVVDEMYERAPLSGLTYADGDWLLCDFAWFDRSPEGDDLKHLLAIALAALD